MSTVLKVLLGVVIGGVLLIAGCAALVAGGANEVSKSITKEQNRNAITNGQARALKLGVTLGAVKAKFGKPKDTQESTNAGLGSDSCVYYNIKGGKLLDSWQFCFDGAGNGGKLRSKNRM